MAKHAEIVRAIFDREIAEMESNMEPSGYVLWLGDLRDEVLAALHNDSDR